MIHFLNILKKKYSHYIFAIDQFLFIAFITLILLTPSSSGSTSQQFVDIGNAFTDAHRYQEAIDAYNKALELDPNNAQAWRGKGLALKDSDQFEEAIAALNKATDIYPDFLDAWMHKGWALDSISKKQEAKNVFQQVIDIADRLISIDPNETRWKSKGDNPWHYKGEALYSLGDYEKALASFEKATSIAPDNPYSWNGKGQTLFALGKYQEALETFDMAIQIRSNNAGFWQNKGNTLKALGNFQESNRAYDKAFEITKAFSDGGSSSGNLFSDGLKYFSFMGIISLVTIGIILYFEKKEKNKPEFRNDLKTKHLSGYYLALTGLFILSVIFIFISSTVAFKELPVIFDYNKFLFAIPILYLSASSFILMIGLSTSKPNTKLNKVHFIMSLILGILLFGALNDPETPVFLPFLPLISAGLSYWYDRIAILNQDSSEKLMKKSTPPVPFSNEIVEQKDNSNQQDIDITSTFDYKGAIILYKVKFENTISAPIADLKISIFAPNVFLLPEKEKSIALLKPGESKTVTFEIRPTGECGICEISGKTAYYETSSNRTKEMEIGSKMLSIVCPILKAKEISEVDWDNTIINLLETEESTKEIEMPAETLFKMTSRIIKDMHMYALQPELAQSQQLFNGAAHFYGEGVKGLRYAAKVEVVGGARKSKLILKAWAEKEDALTGFYHGILDRIEKRINIKSYIDEPILRQYIHIGDRIGTQIKDSFVQRSTIGADARKCPNCGREVDAKEKFCMGCGVKL